MRAGRFADWIDEGMPRPEVPAVASDGVAAEVAGAPATPSAAVSPAGTDDPVGAALVLASLVEEDTQQRAVEVPVSSREAAVDVRDAILDALSDTDSVHVRPWIWTPASTGAALTDGGRRHGIEVRLSYYR